jgi:hypothetical protein
MKSLLGSRLSRRGLFSLGGGYMGAASALQRAPRACPNDMRKRLAGQAFPICFNVNSARR